MHFSAQDMLKEWLTRYPDAYLSPSVFNTSMIESKFGQVGYTPYSAALAPLDPFSPPRHNKIHARTRIRTSARARTRAYPNSIDLAADEGPGRGQFAGCEPARIAVEAQRKTVLFPTRVETRPQRCLAAERTRRIAVGRAT